MTLASPADLHIPALEKLQVHRPLTELAHCQYF